MSGSAINTGGVRFEYLPHVDDEKIRWRARMRQHTGMGISADAAAADLVKEIEKELAAAKSGQVTLRKSPATPEPVEGEPNA